MRRREFIPLLGGAAVAWPLTAKGQSTQKVWRLAWLGEGTNAATARGFFDALEEIGYTEGQNLTVENRFANGRVERLPPLAGELGGVKGDVSGTTTTQAFNGPPDATSTS